jgi:DNA invertase Pin-like site-specific DNA recombinase
MRYVIFSRVSTVKQVDESQLFKCREYINSVKKAGDEVIEFNEPATSTRLKMTERPVLMKMLDFLKKGDTLVVFCITRIARTGTEVVNIYEEHFTNKKAILVSIQQPKVDKTYIHLYAMFGEMTRDTISINTKAGLMKKQSKMEKVGTCWYGYKTDPTKLQLTRPDCHSFEKPYLLIPDEDESAQVELMKELFLEGYSYGQIARELETKGHRNRKGNPIQKSTIFRVLRRLKMQDQALEVALSR